MSVLKYNRIILLILHLPYVIDNRIQSKLAVSGTHIQSVTCCRHILNSMKVVETMERKVEKFDRAFQAQCIAERNYEKLEMYVMDLLMNG